MGALGAARPTLAANQLSEESQVKAYIPAPVPIAPSPAPPPASSPQPHSLEAKDSKGSKPWASSLSKILVRGIGRWLPVEDLDLWLTGKLKSGGSVVIGDFMWQRDGSVFSLPAVSNVILIKVR